MQQKVYLLESDGFYKIGVADNITKRIRNLQTGNPHKINLVAACKFDKPHDLELGLHNLLKNVRDTGEWFRLNSAQAELLKDTLSAIDKGDMGHLHGITGAWQNVIQEINSH